MAMTAQPSRGARPAARLLHLAYVALVYGFFYLPILVIILFAFNGKPILTLPLENLGLQWFRDALSNHKLMSALWASTWIGLVTAVLACAIGMPAAMVLAWRPFRGKSAVLGLILAPIIIPQMVVGISLLLLFRVAPDLLGPIAIIIAHTTLTLCLSVMIFYSRLLGFRRSYIEAAMDLGASEFRVFVEVVLPLTMPAIMAVLLMAFTESFGEFIVAWFVAGFEETLPIAIWTSLRYVLSPRINAIATLIMLASAALTTVAQLWILRQTRTEAGPGGRR